MSQKYNRINNDAVMEISIEMSRYKDKYYNFNGFSADWGLS